jgi:hypothetical protein
MLTRVVDAKTGERRVLIGGGLASEAGELYVTAAARGPEKTTAHLIANPYTGEAWLGIPPDQVATWLATEAFQAFGLGDNPEFDAVWAVAR